jgi:hypothetical protein
MDEEKEEHEDFYAAWKHMVNRLHGRCIHPGFMCFLSFNPKEERDMFLRNV